MVRIQSIWAAYGKESSHYGPSSGWALLPQLAFLNQFYRKNQEFKRQQEKQYNQHHQTRPQLELEEGDEVGINTDNKNTRGYVTSPANTSRSYIVDTLSGQLRRNRNHLLIIPSPADELPTDSDDREHCYTGGSAFVYRRPWTG